MSAQSEDIAFDYKENYMTVNQLADRYHVNPKSIRAFLRKEGILRSRGRRPIVTQFGNRRCERCKSTKPLVEFHKDKTRSQGRDYVCKECRNK